MKLLFALTIGLSAFLLFQVQPMIAKMLLPWYGGAGTVWATCMLFFQVLLLGGYGYAHWVSSKGMGRLHALIVVASLLAARIIPPAHWQPGEGENPTVSILLVLAGTIGAAYFVLSATAVLVQAWYTRSGWGGDAYRLYSLSNAGSLLALVTYPLIVEPWTTTGEQALAWRIGYGLFVVMMAWLAWRSAGSPAIHAADESKASSIGDKVLWFALPACASALFLSLTNVLTGDVAPMPFLWVLPLGLYLVSFILTFDSPRWYARNLYLAVFALAPLALLVVWNEGLRQVGLPSLIGICSVTVFAGCMVCHGETARLRPGKGGLTLFYLFLAGGGAAGGFFVAIVAPYVFNRHSELHVALGAAWLTCAWVLLRDPESRYSWERQRRRATVLVACAAIVVVVMTLQAGKLGAGERVGVRNFYGSLSVGDAGGVRSLRHGAIVHGRQLLDKARSREPIAYYCAESGMGITMRETAGKPRSIGVMGLGAGTMAAFGRAGDQIRFYEINPLVEWLARKEFSYIADSAAEVTVEIGDGRLLVERERERRFDVLAMDAFSGDAVPAHLLTLEAFRIYEGRLREGGVLAVNVSNNFLDLAPLVAAAARGVGRVARLVESMPNSDRHCEPANWVLVVEPTHPLAGVGKGVQEKPGVRAWRDDYSSLWGVVRW